MSRVGRRLAAAVFVVLVSLAAAADEAFVTPGDNLVVDGIPKIPMSIADKTARYTAFRTATLQSWHPTRREMLVSTRFADSQQVHIVRQPLGARSQLTFFPDRVAGAFFNPVNGDYFL